MSIRAFILAAGPTRYPPPAEPGSVTWKGALAHDVAPRWGVSADSAQREINRYLAGGSLSTEHVSDILAHLGCVDALREQALEQIRPVLAAARERLPAAEYERLLAEIGSSIRALDPE